MTKIVGKRTQAYLSSTTGKVCSASGILGTNAFDQFGVELGKTLAQPIAAALGDGRTLPDAADPSTRALVKHVHSLMRKRS